ncbi:MAG: hypothetical protein LBK75_05025 [Oscillospiraceae bacterium]|nr:hypothetical protein [Oscillospiraceae bacterium]
MKKRRFYLFLTSSPHGKPPNMSVFGAASPLLHFSFLDALLFGKIDTKLNAWLVISAYNNKWGGLRKEVIFGSEEEKGEFL